MNKAAHRTHESMSLLASSPAPLSAAASMGARHVLNWPRACASPTAAKPFCACLRTSSAFPRDVTRHFMACMLPRGTLWLPFIAAATACGPSNKMPVAELPRSTTAALPRADCSCSCPRPRPATQPHCRLKGSCRCRCVFWRDRCLAPFWGETGGCLQYQLPQRVHHKWQITGELFTSGFWRCW